MKVQWKGGVARIEGVAFDARLCLIDSAQSFVWREHEGKFYAALLGGAVCIEPIEEGLLIYRIAEDQVEDFIHYLDLVRDYAALADQYAVYPYAARALREADGLRVLNQPVWDTLLSFILSANNNVARIRKLCWLLSEHFGERCEIDGLVLHEMPSPAVLSDVPEESLRRLGFGYRAPFLIQTARMVRDGFPLDRLRDLPYDEAHQLLIQLSGVGDKVADCVLLFGCSHASAFPVDVWVDRLMRAWFPELARAKSRLMLQRAARELLGGDAGLIQQFMFHCARCGLIEVGEEPEVR